MAFKATASEQIRAGVWSVELNLENRRGRKPELRFFGEPDLDLFFTRVCNAISES